MSDENTEESAADPLSPADRYQELFIAVQSARVFEDSKTFVDCVPLDDPRAILHAYRRESADDDFDLESFVHRHFRLPDLPAAGKTAIQGDAMIDHIRRLWDDLLREPRPPRGGSLLPVVHPYVVPGGRFRELYYWDSYFIMLGLAEDGRTALVKGMTDNFADLIDRYGHVPNANRSYYLSRSQPPVFVFMVQLCMSIGASSGDEYYHPLRQEYSWWMDGADQLRPGEQHRHCVRLPDGALLNRYWDDRDTPREESFLEDVTTAKRSQRPAHQVYRDLRAAAASGWDFSSRWCDDPDDLSTTMTTRIAPVDLNSFLYELERLIAVLADRAGHVAAADSFRERAQARKSAINTWLWDDSQGAYCDLDLAEHQRRASLTAACAAPLWVGVADEEKAARTAETLRRRLLRAGGLGTSEHTTGQQWDRPNGWAPLQWIAIKGLERYGQPLAAEIADRWLRGVKSHYDREQKLVEKYAMLTSAAETTGGDGGEYPLQDGFGWTNGVVAALLADVSLRNPSG